MRAAIAWAGFRSLAARTTRVSTSRRWSSWSSLRLCSNVPGQWAVQTALGGYQSIKELVSPGGRLYESRRAIANAVASSRFLDVQPMRARCTRSLV